MPNKNIDPESENYPQEESMSKKDLEQYFTAIKADLDEFRLEVNTRFNRLEKSVQSILDIIRIYDVERKEIKSALWEHERRLMKLEKALTNS